MPYPAQGLYPSSLLYPLEVGVEFVNFTKDFKRFVDRYGRALKNHRTNSSFRAILSVLKGTKCLGDGTTLRCGDAVAYVVPSLSYEIGDHITPVSGRGEWIIITERYASRIGDLRIFRALGLERYTPSTTLKGVYTVVEPAIVEVDIVGKYALTQEFVSLVMSSKYDINALVIQGIELIGSYDLTQEFVSLVMSSRYDVHALDVPGIVLAGKYDLTQEMVPFDITSKYDIIALEGAYPASTLYPSTSLYPRGPGREVDMMSAEFVGAYDITEERISLEMSSKYDINALAIQGIELIGSYDLTQEFVSLVMSSRYDVHALDVPGIVLAGKYDLTQEFVSLVMSSRYDVHALDVPGIVLAGKYDLTQEFVSLEMVCRYKIISTDVGKEIVALYNITKTPAQVAGERAVATGDMIDNYWNPWNDEDLSYYKVHRSLNIGFAPSDANLVGVPTTNAFKHINLAAVTQYYFKVCAVTKLGVSGTYSAQFTATTA